MLPLFAVLLNLPRQDEGSIICPECARKKMTEELEAQNDD
jgi:hypothetical protein